MAKMVLNMRNITLLITTASHILSITSDSLWGFFLKSLGAETKGKGIYLFFSMCLPSFQIFC